MKIMERAISFKVFLVIIYFQYCSKVYFAIIVRNWNIIMAKYTLKLIVLSNILILNLCPSLNFQSHYLKFINNSIEETVALQKCLLF